MKKFENVKNFKGFAKDSGSVDLSMLPKLGGINGTRNDRDLTYRNVKFGGTYSIPTELAIIDGEKIVTIQTVFVLKTMYKQEKASDYVCVLANDEINNVIMTFNEMLHVKTLVRRIKDEVIKYYEKNAKNIEEKLTLKKMLDEANMETLKANNDKNEVYEKYVEEQMAHGKTYDELQDTRVALREAETQIMVLEKTNEKLGEKVARIEEQTRNIFTTDDVEYLRFYLANNNISTENLTKVMNAFVERKFN